MANGQEFRINIQKLNGSMREIANVTTQFMRARRILNYAQVRTLTRDAGPKPHGVFSASPRKTRAGPTS